MAKSAMQICRLCLNPSPFCVNLSEPQYYVMLGALKVNQITAKNVGCTKCILNLKFAYKIQQGMMKAYHTLNRSEKILALQSKESSATVKENNVEMKFANKESKENESVIGPLSTHTGWTPSVIDDEFCVICGTNVPDEEINVHTKEHFKDFTCCSKDFPHVSDYKNHYRAMHSELQSHIWECNICTMKFRYQFLSEVHTKNAHPLDKEVEIDDEIEEDSMLKENSPEVSNLSCRPNEFLGPTNCEGSIDWPHPLECETCGKKFNNYLKYKFHPHKQVECGLCKTKIYLDEFKVHWKKHQVKVPKICEICGMSGIGKGWISYHKSQVHSKSEFKCDECGKLFYKRNYLLLHIGRTHKSEVRKQCEICGSTFFSGAGLKKHINEKHLNVRPFHCSVCKKSFCNIYTLKTHQRQHSNETPYKCEECGEGFKHNVSLKAHKKSKHGIEEEKNFPCDKCDKKFGTLPALKGHKRKKH